MKKLLLSFVLAVLLLPSPSTALVADDKVREPYFPKRIAGWQSAPIATRDYWPLAPGNKWTFTNNELLGSRMEIGVLDSPESFGCVEQPFHLFFHKDDPRNYWAPAHPAHPQGHDLQLHWFLTRTAEGDLVAVGDFAVDMFGATGGTLNYRSLIPGSQAYLLFPNEVTHGDQYLALQVYPVAPGPYFGCIPFDPERDIGLRRWWWQVRWTFEKIDVPALAVADEGRDPRASKRLALKVEFTESSEGRDYFKETWYFVRGVGPVRVVVYITEGEKLDPPLVLELSEFFLNN